MAYPAKSRTEHPSKQPLYNPAEHLMSIKIKWDVSNFFFAIKI